MSQAAADKPVAKFESRLVWPAVILLVGLVGLEIASAGRKQLQVRETPVRPADSSTDRADPAGPVDLRIDLNRAGEAELEQLPCIGKKRAADIVAFRNAHGPFRRPQDVMKIRGIKEGIFGRIAPHVRVSDPGQPLRSGAAAPAAPREAPAAPARPDASETADERFPLLPKRARGGL